jgi:hypothetical protein
MNSRRRLEEGFSPNWRRAETNAEDVLLTCSVPTGCMEERSAMPGKEWGFASCFFKMKENSLSATSTMAAASFLIECCAVVVLNGRKLAMSDCGQRRRPCSRSSKNDTSEIWDVVHNTALCRASAGETPSKVGSSITSAGAAWPGTPKLCLAVEAK